MKKLIILIVGILVAGFLCAQEDTTQVKVLNKNVVTVVEGENGTKVKVGDNDEIEVKTDEEGDTTQIRIGSKVFRVIEKEKGTQIEVDREKEKKEKQYSSFNGHWSGLEIGMNMYRDQDYSLYSGMNVQGINEFMDLNHAKSITVNLNFSEIAFKNKQRNFGLVTGMGLSFMDYTFDRPLTIIRDEAAGKLSFRDLTTEKPKKSKLNVSYLTVPLMLEVKTPLKHRNSHLYLAGGAIGGLNIGSHTKIKYNKDKDKERKNFYINPFKLDLTGRIGFGDFCIIANYGITPLFKDSKGPELYPLTIGISFPNI